jgi:hypothetical protein
VNVPGPETRSNDVPELDLGRLEITCLEGQDSEPNEAPVAGHVVFSPVREFECPQERRNGHLVPALVDGELASEPEGGRSGASESAGLEEAVECGS